jgi:tetratricopeptide (TPR) repeat protein
MMADLYRCQRRGPCGLVLQVAGSLLAGLVHSWLLVATSPVTAEDTVVLWSRDGSQQIRSVGEILDFRGSGLLLRHRSGREETIPIERVIEVQTQWHAQHVAGDRQFDSGFYEEALRSYAEALRDGPRDWVRRRILARSLRCLLRLGKTQQAVEVFLLIWREDHQTPHFELIPLPWTTQPTPAGLQERARIWIQDRSSAAARLIGASWLVTTADRTESLRVLRELARCNEPRIAFLAEAQLWRTEVVTATAQDANRWGARIERMPELLRAGPYHVVGQLLSRQKRHEDAAMAFLKAALLHAEQYPLVAESLLAAARELAKIDQLPQAARLCEEILARFPESEAAQQAARERAAFGASSPPRETEGGP